MLLTRSPLVYPRKGLTVRLACVKHTASVRPEPGSNSPSKKSNTPTPTQQCRHRHIQKFNTEPNHRQTPTTHTTCITGAINQRKKQETNPKKDPFPKNNTHQNNTPPQKKQSITPADTAKKIGIDLKHAVEFSKFGSHPCGWRLDQLYPDSF